MLNLYGKNGLVFWDEEQIRLREQFVSHISENLNRKLREMNNAFRMYRVEAPILTPKELINKGYTSDDVWTSGDLVLRPETTMGSYQYARHLAETKKYPLPCAIWQLGKSFRKEQDQSTKFMRLKEFYQLEFQVLYATNTKADYPGELKNYICDLLAKVIGHECSMLPSDRLPDYSMETTDIECRGMEICSMSVRTDFAGANNFEIAIGADRLIFQYQN